MRRLRRVRHAIPAGILLAISGCASIPSSDIDASRIPELSCAALMQELALARESHLAADGARRKAWRALLPLLVAGRYAHAANAKQEAANRIALVEEHSRFKDCPPAPPELQSEPTP